VIPALCRLGLFLLLIAGAPAGARAAETIPPAPPAHFNDYAGIVAPGAAHALDAELEQFERDTSNQLVVAIYPHMQSDSSIEDYTVRVAQAWHAGAKGRDNGAVLFIFSQDRTLYIQVGYGLEPVLTDILCKRIIADQIAPAFRSGDFTAGVTAGVHAMMAAARGEYQGTGRTVGDRANRRGAPSPMVWIIFLLVVGASALFSRRRRVLYGRSGRSTIWFGGPRGGSGWGGGGGGGGGFSGGGGSFGGGGAGGSW
jgi:uncharacterized protein